MPCISSQFIVTSPTKVLHNHAIELDNNGAVCKLIGIENLLAEPSQTLFYNGIISAGIVSLRNEMSLSEIDKLRFDFNYIHKSEIQSERIFQSNEKALVLDFETNNLAEISSILIDNINVFSKLNVFELISALSFYPIKILNWQKQIQLTDTPELILWKGVDLVNKMILDKIKLVHL